MRPTYEPYSTLAVTFKAALIPFALAGVKVFHDLFAEALAEGMRGPLLHLLCTLSVVLIEVSFNKFISFINAREISERLKKIEKTIAKLNELLEIENDPKTRTAAGRQLSSLKTEQVALLGKSS